jgi:hypothetical protein
MVAEEVPGPAEVNRGETVADPAQAATEVNPATAALEARPPIQALGVAIRTLREAMRNSLSSAMKTAI